MIVPGVPHDALGVLDRLNLFHLYCKSLSIKLLAEPGIYSLHSAAAHSALLPQLWTCTSSFKHARLIRASGATVLLLHLDRGLGSVGQGISTWSTNKGITMHSCIMQHVVLHNVCHCMGITV